MIHERSADGLLATFILDSTISQSLDVWIAKVRSLLSEWPAHEPCRMLHDLRKINPCTAIKLLQSEALAGTPSDLRLRTAILIDSDATNSCLKSLQVGEYHVFMSRGTALIWLLDQVD